MKPLPLFPFQFARALLIATIVMLTTCFPMRAAVPDRSVEDLPSGKQWTVHVYRDLLPFWMSPAAVGMPEGAFPTFRYNDGMVVDSTRPLRDEYKCLGQSHPEITNRLSRRYVRTLSRQTYLYGVGQRCDRDDLCEFARLRAPRVLKEAYLPHVGAWGEGKLEDGAIDEDRVWWIYAELDQMAGTLMLDDELCQQMASYLVPTYGYWFGKMVDREQGEVWHMIDAKTGQPELPKVHLWKNGFHSFEHALVGYITCQAVRHQPVELYFGFQRRPADAEIQPYYFRAETVSVENGDYIGFRDLRRWRVVFTDVHE